MTKGTIPDHIIDEVRSKIDIVSLVSGHVNLKKAGRNYLGLCPFHKEKTPSFTVSPDKQIFYCFGCGEGGNAVAFTMKINSMSFPEAIRHLAGKVGVVLPERSLTPEDRKKIGIREELVGINRSAASVFGKNLFSAAGKRAQDYLNERGLREETIRAFRLGYAFDGWRHLRDYLQKERVSLRAAEQAGLLVAKEDGSFYDRFRGRLMFPIDDLNGRTIAFGGRVIGAGEPKYLNSPESPIYTKGRNLYGLNVTRESIRQKGFAIVVEGYFDLISLWNAGITHVVATLGTALTREHVELIRRYTTQVAAVFDPDEAGRKALGRSLDLFLGGNVQMKAVILPDGYDPDDYVRTFGPERFEEAVEKAGPAVEYYIDSVLGKRGSLQHDRDMLKEAVLFISRIENAGERSLFIRRIAERLGVDEKVLGDEVAAQARVTTARTPEAPRKPTREEGPAQVDAIELSLILLMLSHPRMVERMRQTDILAYFVTKSLKTLGEDIQERFAATGGIDASAVIDGMADGALKKQILGRLVEEGMRGEETLDRVFSDTVINIKKKWYKEKHRLLKVRLMKAQEAGDYDKISQLLMEKARLSEDEKAYY